MKCVVGNFIRATYGPATETYSKHVDECRTCRMSLEGESFHLEPEQDYNNLPVDRQIEAFLTKWGIRNK